MPAALAAACVAGMAPAHAQSTQRDWAEQRSTICTSSARPCAKIIPALLDPANPAFLAWYRYGFKGPIEHAGHAKSSAGYYFAVKYYASADTVVVNRWLRAAAMPLTTIEPNSGFGDLAPIGRPSESA
jgi:hypothetical protein